MRFAPVIAALIAGAAAFFAVELLLRPKLPQEGVEVTFVKYAPQPKPKLERACRGYNCD